MPCLEFKELEAMSNRVNERRVDPSSPTVERRSVFAVGLRAAQARLAYLMQAHRRDCGTCLQRLP